MYAYADKKQATTDKKKVKPSQKSSQMQTVAFNATGIPDTLKTRFENRSGFSFDDVRVHYNSDKPAQLQSFAYTQGNEVFIAPGQEKHLGHELGHVVQQKQGIVRSTTHVAGLPVNDSQELENAADHLCSETRQQTSMPENIIQRKIILENPDGERAESILPELLDWLKHGGVPTPDQYTSTLQSMIKDDVMRVFKREGGQSELVALLPDHDVVEEILWQESEDTVSLKQDVNRAMLRLKATLLKWLVTDEKLMQAIIDESKIVPRERPLYFKESPDIFFALNSWDESWTIEKTAGLLLDLGYHMRKKLGGMEVMNATMKSGRPEMRDKSTTEPKGFNERRDDPNFESNVRARSWGQHLPDKSEIRSGISASTGNLLLLLKALDDEIDVSFDEVGAIMLSVFRFWNVKPGTKKALDSGLDPNNLQFRNEKGLFHTATEIWSVYTYVYLTQHLLHTDASTFEVSS